MRAAPRRATFPPPVGEGIARRTLAAASISAALMFLGPVGAQASKIEGLAYTAAPGEENHIEVSYDSDAQAFRFHDSGVASIDSSGPQACSVEGNSAACPMDWTGQVVVRLGDRNDSAVITNQLPHVKTPSNLYSGTVQMMGGDGDDTLDAGPGIPSTGDLMTTSWVSLWGDGFPSDPVDYGRGNDILIGGAGEDGFVGGPGNDEMIGNGGRDAFDGSPFFTNPDAVATYAAGADTMDGGRGSDTFDGIEASAQNAVDTITCGSGDEGPLLAGFLPGRDMETPGDVVALGSGDSVSADCESVASGLVCPERLNHPCFGTAVIEGSSSRAKAAS